MAADQIEAEALAVDEVAALLGVSRRTVFALSERDPKFPRSVRISPGRRSRRWIRSEVLTFLREVAERDEPTSRQRA
jgi:predicted DNA-binding transcriptional regulator AlpA